MADPIPADLPDVDDDVLQDAGMLPQTAAEGVTPVTNQVDADDMFSGGTD